MGQSRSNIPGAYGPVLPGTFVDGKYRVEELIGAGGMAVVYRAEHVHSGRVVAMKVLLPCHRSEVLRFHREARLAASIRHPHVVQTFDRGILPEGLPYLTMELLEGQTLGAHLRARGPLAIDQAVDVAEQILGALSAAHSLGIVHRDLKPDNVFLVARPAEGELHAKLFDFGVCRPIDSAAPRMTLEGTTLGTPEYLSPEQARGDGDLDHRSDLWAAGVVLYECLTGRPPFVGATLEALLVEVLFSTPQRPGAFGAEVPAALEEVVLTALEKRRSDRFASADDMIYALRRATGRRDTLEIIR